MLTVIVALAKLLAEISGLHAIALSIAWLARVLARGVIKENSASRV